MATKGIMDLLFPNPDGEDYGEGGKFEMYSVFLQRIREGSLPEDTKLRFIKYLKEKAFPFL